jgi:predicted Zn-ribbon and HTH transcriptional regulator
MSPGATVPAEATCLNCGFTAETDGGWETVDHPTLGSLTRCPECQSTDVTTT